MENVGKRDNSSKKVLVLLFAICGCVLLVGAVSACLAFGLELYKLKSETASSLQQLKSETVSNSTLEQLKSETTSTLQKLPLMCTHSDLMTWRDLLHIFH